MKKRNYSKQCNKVLMLEIPGKSGLFSLPQELDNLSQDESSPIIQIGAGVLSLLFPGWAERNTE